MPRLPIRSLVILSALSCIPGIPGGASATCQAGLIPWTYNAIFGYGPAWSPGWGYASYGYPVTWSAAYPVSAAPTTTFYGGGWSVADPCCNPCPVSCNPCCPTCGPGGCPGGDCGVRYAPEGTTGTPTEPPANAPQGEPTYREPINEDDFRPVNPREDDSRRQQESAPDWQRSRDSSIPAERPFDVTTPPGGSTIPRSGTDSIGPGSPAPGEPGSGVLYPPRDDRGNDTNILEIPLAPVASLKVPRQRILMEARYQTPALSRASVAPATVESAVEGHVARR